MPRFGRTLTSLYASATSLLTSEYVDLASIQAGREPKSYSVHKNLLISKAPHFAGGLSNSAFKEAEERKFEFKDVDGDVLGAFVGWLYKDSLNDVPDDTTESFDLAIRLYEFADSINLINLQNECLDLVRDIVTNTNWTPKWREIAAHFDNSMSDDKMRSLLVDFMAWSFMSSKQANVRSTLSDGILNEDLVVELLFRINQVGLSAAHDLKPLRPKEWYHIERKTATSTASNVPELPKD